LTGRRTKGVAAASPLRDAPLEEILRVLRDPSSKPDARKQAKRELHRRRTMGLKVDVPDTASPVPKAAAPARADEIRCWISPHIYGFKGQLLGTVFVGEEGVRALIVMAVLDPDRRLRAGFLEQTSIKRFKELLASFGGPVGKAVPAESGFGLARLFDALDGVEPERQDWEGNRNQAAVLLERTRPLASAGGAHPAERLVDLPEEAVERMRRDSALLRARPAFREWKPETAALRLIVEKMNMVAGGKISASKDSKMSALDAILQREVDEYFTPQRRARVASSLLDNAYVAHIQKDGEGAREQRALAAVVEDGSIPARSIGFLVECLRSGFSLGEGEGGRVGEETPAGRIIIPGARADRGEEPGDSSILTAPTSLIQKP
jgi:hypothetical protein